MKVVVVSAGPEGEKVAERPGKVVARVRVDGLEETEGDPKVDGENVQVLAEEAVKEGARDRALRKDKDLERVRVLGSLPSAMKRLQKRLQKRHSQDR